MSIQTVLAVTKLPLIPISVYQIISYISKCVKNLENTKSIPNQKAWMNGERRDVSRVKKGAFWSGDKDAYNTARARPKTGIKEVNVETSAETRKRPHHQKHQRHMAGDPGHYSRTGLL